MGKIETQLEAKRYAIGGTFLNIKGAIDSISNMAIKEATTRQSPQTVSKLDRKDMLTGKNLLVEYGDIAIRGKPDRGCPQREVLFPLLWCLVVDLLKELQRKGVLTYAMLMT
ncbi:lian-aa1 retrotransposon protein [Lasius niger]|uniref:Lian-aa1 retrotransposon protein n=1 Tax=Lasius niger TaxID=67767 RepID=A0A0J7KP27_LASNI|nr:lian-aa1 retrotransposon protein [Lasius niger]